MLLLIEVADTSLPFDRDVKLPLYAAAGVTEVWVVDLPADRIEVCRGPVGGVYSERETRTEGPIRAPAIPRGGLEIRDILPPRSPGGSS